MAGKMAASPSDRSSRPSIQSRAAATALCRLRPAPVDSRSLMALSVRRKNRFQVDPSGSLASEPEKISESARPAGARRLALVASRIERGASIARLQDDIE